MGGASRMTRKDSNTDGLRESVFGGRVRQSAWHEEVSIMPFGRRKRSIRGEQPDEDWRENMMPLGIWNEGVDDSEDGFGHGH
eukprot:3173989-Prymnesium_polylepis.1